MKEKRPKMQKKNWLVCKKGEVKASVTSCFCQEKFFEIFAEGFSIDLPHVASPRKISFQCFLVNHETRWFQLSILYRPFKLKHSRYFFKRMNLLMSKYSTAWLYECFYGTIDNASFASYMFCIQIGQGNRDHATSSKRGRLERFI